MCYKTWVESASARPEQSFVAEARRKGVEKIA